MGEPYAMTAVALTRAIREKRLGVAELTRAYLDRIGQYDGTHIRQTVEYAVEPGERVTACLLLPKDLTG